MEIREEMEQYLEFCQYRKELSRNTVKAYRIDLEQFLRYVKEALSEFPSKESALYRCPFCGSERFIGHQVIRADVYVDESGEFDGNLPSGLEASTYDSSAPYGPFTCVKCSQEFDELPGNKQVKLTGGIFTVVSDEMVQKFKEIGYGYSHEENGYIVVNDGKRAVAVSNYDYDHYYDGQKTIMM